MELNLLFLPFLILKKIISQRKDLIKFFFLFRRVAVTTVAFWGGGRFAGGKDDWRIATVK